MVNRRIISKQIERRENGHTGKSGFADFALVIASNVTDVVTRMA